MPIPRRISSLTLLAGLAAVMTFVPAGNRAAAAICPQFLAQYCVVEKDGYKHTEWTNPCVSCQSARHRFLPPLRRGRAAARDLPPRCGAAAPPLASTRALQYSQVRVTTVGIELSTPASLISPRCRGAEAASDSARI